MVDTVIKVKSLSKQYRLGVVGTGTLSHDLNRWWARVRGKEDPTLKVTESNVRSDRGHSEYVWALKDVDFDVRQGEALGIIGRNGAGKSTLLKIISRVTAPSQGEVKVKGRIGSLLEVGTGFHPELTGLENIYLNGAILGMSKVETRQRLDEIIDFSGCERYISTPVKRYSSGMLVRLGFAVAAHLDPEILIVDEVLAVGDAEFQKKCLGKMKEVAGHGRTVLFVTHNMNAVRALCSRVLLIDEGKLVNSGDTVTITDLYFSSSMVNDRWFFDPKSHGKGERTGNARIRLQAYRFVHIDGKERLLNSDSICIEALVNVVLPGKYSMCVPVKRGGEISFYANSYHEAGKFIIDQPGSYAFRFFLPPYLLNPGFHTFGLFITDEKGAHDHYVRIEDALQVEILDDGYRRGNVFTGQWPGPVSPVLKADVYPLER